MRMRHIVICGLSLSIIFIFLLYLIKSSIFEEKKIFEPEMWVLNFCTNAYASFLILRRNGRDIIVNLRTSSCNVPVILFRF